MTRNTTITVLFIAFLIGGAAWLTRDASAQLQGPFAGEPQYEYLLLVLDDNRPVALTAGERVEIVPPARLPSGRIDDPGVSNNSYSVRTVDERHVSVGALNLLGEQGWEAVSTVPYGNGATAVLLKRRAG